MIGRKVDINTIKPIYPGGCGLCEMGGRGVVFVEGKKFVGFVWV